MSKARNLSQVIVDAGGDINASSLDNVTPASISDKTNTSTGAFDLPVGTTAERPGSPSTGMVRYNSDRSEYEVYDDSAWKPLTQGTYLYTAESLQVAGGASGGSTNGGGGGAGGVLYTSSNSLTIGTSYSIVIGAGGAG